MLREADGALHGRGRGGVTDDDLDELHAVDGVEEMQAGHTIADASTAAELRDGQRRRVGQQQCVGANLRGQLAKEFLLEIEALDGGFDDEIDVAQGHVGGGGLEAVAAGAGFEGSEEAAFYVVVVKLLNRGDPAGDGGGVDVFEDDADAVGTEPVGNASAHDARADDGDGADAGRGRGESFAGTALLTPALCSHGGRRGRRKGGLSSRDERRGSEGQACRPPITCCKGGSGGNRVGELLRTFLQEEEVD